MFLLFSVLISTQKDEPDSEVIKELALFYGVSPSTMTSLVKEVTDNFVFLYILYVYLFLNVYP
jgi:hypothetical protein